MPIPYVIALAAVAIVLILLVFFHRRVIEILYNIKDSFDDFLMSIKYGNFTEREEAICNIYLNYHYPVYSPYRSYCWNCEAEVKCGACHPNCSDRDEKIYISEKEVRALLKSKKKKAMKHRINSVKGRANDKIYYCAPVEREFGSSQKNEK